MSAMMAAALLRAKATPSSNAQYKGLNYDLLVLSVKSPRVDWNPNKNVGKALIRVKAAGVNPVDCKFITPFSNKDAPFMLDFSGVIEEVGYNDRGLKAGDAVMGLARSGSCCEYVNAELSGIAKKPEAITFEEAAGMGVVYFTGYDGLFAATAGAKNSCRRAVNSSSVVLVIGASGGTGLAGVQLAKRCALAKLVVGVCSRKNSDIVKQRGADVTIDYEKIDFSAANDNVLEEIQNEVKKQGFHLNSGFDLVYDCVSSKEDFNYRPVCEKMLLKKAENEEAGHYVCINSASAGLWIKALLTRFTGLSWFLPRNVDLFLPTPTEEKADRLSAWFAEGKLKIDLHAVYDFKTGKSIKSVGATSKAKEENTTDQNDSVCLNGVIESQCSRRAVGKIVVTNIG